MGFGTGPGVRRRKHPLLASRTIAKGHIFVADVTNVSIIGYTFRLDFGLVLLRIYVALAVFQPYRDLEAGDNQSLKFKWRGGELNPGPLAPQAKSLTTRPPPLRRFA